MPLVDRIYDFLNVGRKPVRSDRIFVFAGREESRQFGVKLWRVGFAPELILSLSRPELQSFYNLKLPDGGLRQLVESSPEEQTYFFVRVTADGTTASTVKSGRYGTRGQARALRKLAPPRTSVLAVSSPINVRRARVALRRSLPKVKIELVTQETAPAAPQEVWREFRKYVAYLLLP